MSDTGFSSAWLDLREPVDHDARDDDLLRQAAGCARKGRFILDLGSGTGSTARAFKSHAPDIVWRFLDSDPKLLGVAADRHPSCETIVADLRAVETLPLDEVGLVTASALLDLMPESWIEALAQRLKSARIPLYAALNYNGQMAWTPSLPEDASITASFNRHQLTDKGIGHAAGPMAIDIAERLFGNLDFRVHRADSPWTLGAQNQDLQSELLVGIADAASQVGNAEAAGWLDARCKALPNSSMLVGHTDFLAIPG